MTIHMDYLPISGCSNPDSYGTLCVKCNRCHRMVDWTCPLCGTRTRAMKSRQIWRAIETLDVRRLPVCPDCQHHFTDGELGIDRNYPVVLPFRKKQLLLMLAWREKKFC